MVTDGSPGEHSARHCGARRGVKRGAKRRLMLLLLPLALALPAAGAKHVTVAQLEQAIAAASAAHQPDAELARRIRGMELSERLTDATLSRIGEHLTPGSQADLSLRLLADQSAFLAPPASELPAAPAPDDAAQQRMLEAARAYVAQILPRVPDLLATQIVHRYDDSPQLLKAGGWPVRAGLHLVDSSSREVSVSSEQQDPTQGSAVWQEKTGLVSGGEFGSTLSMIVGDTAHGSVGWSRWERAGDGLCAVFHFAVPRSASHFEIIGTVQREAPVTGVATRSGGSRGTLTVEAQPNGIPAPLVSIVRTRPGYHGAFWLDPNSGAILRITIEADAKDSAEFQRAAIMVEYGAVAIGGGRYLCPVRGLALSSAVPDSRAVFGDAPTQWINDTLFTSYHLFASTVRVLNDTETQKPGVPLHSTPE